MWYKISILINLATFGDNESLSARVGRNSIISGGVWSYLEVVINFSFRNKHHCWRAYLWEVKHGKGR